MVFEYNQKCFISKHINIKTELGRGIQVLILKRVEWTHVKVAYAQSAYFLKKKTMQISLIVFKF